MEGPGSLDIRGGIDGVGNDKDSQSLTLTVDKGADVIVYGSNNQAAVTGGVIVSGGRLLVIGGKGIDGDAVLAGGVLEVSVAAGDAGQNVGSVTMAEGYDYDQTQGEWEMEIVDIYAPNVPVATVSGVDKKFSSLHEAIDYAAGASGPDEPCTVTLLTDVETASTVNLDHGQVGLDLNGHSIRYIGAWGPVICLSDYHTDGDTAPALVLTDTAAGGCITGNAGRSAAGGGVYVGSGCTFIMSGGSITGNTAGLGGGVFVSAGAEFHVSGNVTIRDNGAANVFLCQSDGAGAVITVDGALAADARIGVTRAALPKADASPAPLAGVFAVGADDPEYTLTADDVACFTDDSETFVVVLNGIGRAELVKHVPVTEVTLSESLLTLAVGEGATLTATFTPDDATYQSVTWSSDKESIATVDANGKVTAVGEGTATVTATAANGTDATNDDISATCVVTVESKPQEQSREQQTQIEPAPDNGGYYYPDESSYSSGSTTGTSARSDTGVTPQPEPWKVETSITADGASVTKELATNTETRINADGSVTVTDTVKETVTTGNKDGTVVEVETETRKEETTLENADGSVTTTVKDTETVKETVKDADGNAVVTETQTEQKSKTDVTTVENADGTVTETTVTTWTETVTERVTDAEGNVTETKTETVRETKSEMTVKEDGTEEGTSTTMSTVTDEDGNVLSESVTTADVSVKTEEDGTKVTETAATTVTKDADGNETERKTVTTENKTPDGSTGTIVRDDAGNVLAQETAISQEELVKAMEEIRPIQAPLTVDPASLAEYGELPPIKVTLPPAYYDKDGDGKVAPGERPKVEIQVSIGGTGVIVAEVGPDGILTIRKDCYEGSVIVPVNGSCQLVVLDNAKSFTDVAAGAWYGEYVTFVTAREIFNGVGGGAFAPDAAMSRAMLAQVLYNFALGAQAGDGTVFSDVTAEDWFNAAVGWAYETGVFDGLGDGSFGPLEEVSRQDLATVLFRFAEAMGYDVSERAGLGAFPDADDVADYAKEAMEWAVAVGLIKGLDDGTLAPRGSATRAQVAAVMTRFVRGVK